MEDYKNGRPYPPSRGAGTNITSPQAQAYQQPYQQSPHLGTDTAGTTQQNGRSASQPSGIDEAQILTPGGFKPLSKEEKAEAARIALEAGFSFDGYQVVRREFFSHRFDPTLTIKGNSITFNNTCISRLDEVVYVQVLVNPTAEKLVIRPCSEGARDAIRWCVTRNDKRKSREITCKLFTAKLYDMMGWESLYRYKLQGTQISYQGEQLYVFDLTSTEIFLPQVKEIDETTGKPKRHAPRAVYPADWRDSFGLPVQEHTASTQIDLMQGYSYANTVQGQTTDERQSLELANQETGRR